MVGVKKSRNMKRQSKSWPCLSRGDAKLPSVDRRINF